jgi:hypothetical protein
MSVAMWRGPAFGAGRKVVAQFLRISLVIGAAIMTAGCWGTWGDPDRLNPIEVELAPIRAAYTDEHLWENYMAKGTAARMAYRNEMITARMYAIDVNYTQFETRLLQQSQGVDFGTGVANQALTIAAGLEPVVQTKNILTGLAGGFSYVGTAYNEKILLNQTIIHIELGMRQARYDQASVIFTNMKCSTDDYPLGRALEDVERYYRAGTIQSGLAKVTENVTDQTNKAKAVADTQSPGTPPAAKAAIVANAAHADTLQTLSGQTPTCVQQGSPGLGFMRKPKA